MALTYGFYNSVAGDRAYDALQMSSLFDGILEDGVFSTIGGSLFVQIVDVPSGLQVKVLEGRAWFDHTWTNLDAELVLSLPAANPLLPRMDAIVLEVDHNAGVRANDIKVLTGTPGSNPIAPALTKTELLNQYLLATVYVAAGATAINSIDIVNYVGTTQTPFASGALQQVSTSDLLAQWNAQFDVWFDAMKDQLSTDAAGNLQLQIDEIESLAANHSHDLGQGNPVVRVAAGAVGNTQLVDGAVGTSKLANLGVTNVKLANDAVDDTKVGARVPALIRRRGGHSTNWSTPGATVYTPTNVRMQAGVEQFNLPYNTVGAVHERTITFPVAFSQPPLVFIQKGEVSPNDLDGSYLERRWTIRSITASSFVFRYVVEGNGTLNIESHLINMSWLAIGPE